MNINYGIPDIVEYKTVVKKSKIKCHECGTTFTEQREFIIVIKYKDLTYEKVLILAESPVDAWDEFSFISGGIIANSTAIYIASLDIIIDTNNQVALYKDTKYLYELEKLNLKFVKPYRIVEKDSFL